MPCGVQHAALDDDVRAWLRRARDAQARRRRRGARPHRQPRLVVDERDRDAARAIDQLLEQDRLGVRVALHVAVIVQVVLRQVRHGRHAERAARDSSLRQRVRGRF